MTTHEKGQIAAELFADEETGMVWQPVESSQIAEIGYDASTATLGIRFKPGKKSAASEYHYANVPVGTHHALITAESVGTYFGQNIKSQPSLYPYTKVKTDPTEPPPSLNGRGKHSTSTPLNSPTTTATSPETSATEILPPSTALAVIDAMADDLLFTPGAVTDAQLAAGREWYLTEAKKYDISTEKARTEFKRFARPLQKLRTGIEARAKELTGATKRKIAAIDAEKRRLVQIVGGIEDEVLAPLTSWEAEEDARIEERNKAIAEIENAGPYTQANWMMLSTEAMRDRIKELQSDTREWPELGKRVDLARKESIKLITDAIGKRETYDREQAELATLRAEAAERAEKDRKATLANIALQQAEQETAARKAEAEAAVEAERKRAAAVAAEEYAAMEARAADEEHRERVMQEAQAGLFDHCKISIAASRKILEAIAKGLIPHITIQY